MLLKGLEITLPHGVSYRDAHGDHRKTTRTRWWDAGATTIRAASAERSIADRLPEDPLPPHGSLAVGEEKPVFFGHYCLEEAPRLQSSRRACLDFCVARGGALCAYRFDGEPDLDPANLAWVG